MGYYQILGSLADVGKIGDYEVAEIFCRFNKEFGWELREIEVLPNGVRWFVRTGEVLASSCNGSSVVLYNPHHNGESVFSPTTSQQELMSSICAWPLGAYGQT